MAIVVPFKGLTYNFQQREDLSRLVAPPYDVISEEEQEAYYQANPHNVIRLILGKKRPATRIGITCTPGRRIVLRDGNLTGVLSVQRSPPFTSLQ